MKMRRDSFVHDGLKLSYLDAGGDGAALIALHSHWMEGATFAPLAEALAVAPAAAPASANGWRVIALDQRGHGDSDHAATYARADYLGDLRALYAHLGISRAVLLGNSLGGVNAYQFAAKYPSMVRGLIIEDIGAVINDDTSFALAWAGTFPTRAALLEKIGPRFLPFLQDSFREVPGGGWRLAFEPAEMVASQLSLNGDHWDDWLASTCPALVIRGGESRVTKAEHLEEMARRRANTQLRVVPGGHVVHFDNFAGFTEAVREFLREV
ncbi:MAG TPA: alpha/beta hydrolase [Candidatus Acidoferrales bacterium]